MMKPCPPCGPPPGPSYLPITTGRIGLSQTTGGLEFYGHNYHGRGIQLFYGQWCPPPCPPCPPAWPPPTWGGCRPWTSGCCGGSCGGGCGCGCSGCRAGSNCFAYYLTHPAMWICYYRDQAATRILTTPPSGGATG